MIVREKVAVWIIVIGALLILSGIAMEFNWLYIPGFGSDPAFAGGALLFIGGMMAMMWAISTKPIMLDR